MSCKDLGKSENLVYIRRTNGGSSTGGVIYSWDYYLLASLPTNDNIRFQKAKDEISPNVSLHEIGNNRYEDVKCKSVHLAYTIGGFSPSSPISIDAGSNQIEELQETTDNPCVLLFNNSNYFPERTPECWPWSCRRWTREVTRKCDGSVDKSLYYHQDINGNKVLHGSYTDTGEYIQKDVPTIQLLFSAITNLLDVGVAQFHIETLTKDEYPKNCSTSPTNITDIHFLKNYFHGHLYKEIRIDEADEALPDSLLSIYGCESGCNKVTLGVEIFPILCNGVCKLIIKFASLCYKDGSYSIGTGVKKLISPFWSCRINEEISLYKPTNQIQYLDYNIVESPTVIEKATKDEFDNTVSKTTDIIFDVPDVFDIKNTVLTLKFVVKSDISDEEGNPVVQWKRNAIFLLYLTSPDNKNIKLIPSDGQEEISLKPHPNHNETFAYIRFNFETELNDELPNGIYDIGDINSIPMPIYQSDQGFGNPLAWRDGTQISPTIFSRFGVLDSDYYHHTLTAINGSSSRGKWKISFKNYSSYPDIELHTAILSLAKEIPGSEEVATVRIELNGGDEEYSHSDLFNVENKSLLTITGEDYTIKDGKKEYWNLCDKNRYETHFQMISNETIGKADKFIDVQSKCCKKCKKKEPGSSFTTFFDDAFCSELDKECIGIGYKDIEREAGCP